MLPPHQGYLVQTNVQRGSFRFGRSCREQLNQTFRNNRIVLGERRFIERGTELIGAHGETVDQSGAHNRSICLRNETVCVSNLNKGNGPNMLEEASEQLWHRALSVLMNWPGRISYLLGTCQEKMYCMVFGTGTSHRRLVWFVVVGYMDEQMRYVACEARKRESTGPSARATEHPTSTRPLPPAIR